MQLTDNELREQECKWKAMSQEKEKGGASPYYDGNNVPALSHLDAFYGTETSNHMTEASGLHRFENPAEEVTESNKDSMDCEYCNES